MGLSPLVRGKPIVIIGTQLDVGSIPACAGETPPHVLSSDQRWVYPRLCGGNMFPLLFSGVELGLSPLVRGKRIIDPVKHIFTGSIPACAGETAQQS